MSPTSTPEPQTLIGTVNDTLQSAGQVAGQLVTNLPLWLSQLLLAALVILLGGLFVRLGRRLIRKMMRAKEGRTPGQRETLRSLTTSVFNYTMYFLIATIVLGIFGVNVASMIAVAGVGGIAVGFGAQTLVKDVISGIFLWVEGNISVGDIVDVNGLSGEVEAIALRTTSIRTFSGNLIIVPNGDIRTVTNMTRTYKLAVVDVRLPYDVELDKLLSILEDEMQKAGQAIEGMTEPPEVVGVLAFETDCIIARLAALCPIKENWRIERELRKRVKNRFDQEGIQMPHFHRQPLE
jgi:small conductance mechanosensitive channel